MSHRARALLGLFAFAGCAAQAPAQADVAEPAASVSPEGPVPAFEVTATIEVGRAPHGIRFSPDGRQAVVALSGEDELAVIDLDTAQVVERISTGPVPLGLVQLSSGDWLVTEFRGSHIRTASSEAVLHDVGKGPSLFSPRIIEGRAYVVSEFADQLTVVSTGSGKILDTLPTGKQPYPADVTMDGKLAFVPERADGSVTVLELDTKTQRSNATVCPKPEGGALTPDDRRYLLACSGSNEVAVLDVGTGEVLHRINDGIGARPFSVAVTPDGRFGLVNNAGEHSLSVIDLQQLKVTARVEVGEQPIVVRVHPDGTRALVSNEISGTVSVVSIPGATAAAQPATSISS